MKIDRVQTLYFSPTGTTKTVVTEMSREYFGSKAPCFDLTYPEYTLPQDLSTGDLVFVGVPVYAGRVPALAVERLEGLQGNGASMVVTVVYGNREYEDALLELRNMALEHGFRVVAGCAFIGEHSFSTGELPIAAGRPDEDDLKIARKFAQQIRDNVKGLAEKGRGHLDVPGDKPYKEGMMNLPFTVQVDEEKCTLCETCISTCPAGAISLSGQIIMSADLCILCCACIKGCPEEAVSLTAPPIMEKVVWLHENCKERKEPALFTL
ncbi:EFR1 family ferrodoxin [Desulfopila sp. IMCC35008]|uniref:EFR1 family ferrodoxin n=1 Tax=Desulfopila sp. IMCC35008 TaxID=2653858 RepID=UPI0013D59694|nr:EFR1 family ferrodoxin [Desulfopila sp. IMCC35008]